MKHAIELDFPFEQIDQIAEVESYRKEINRPIYHIHKWWAKRLGSVFRSIVSGSLSENGWDDFYKNQTFADKIVLDPFMGSGTTLGESVKLGAKAIGCDVNPVSTFLVKQALTQIDQHTLELEYAAIENDVREEIQSYYTTKLPDTDYPAPVLYYFWVKIVTTPKGEDIPLFSSYVFSKHAYPKKYPKGQIWCPSCEAVFSGIYNNRDEECPFCSHHFDPQNGPAKRTKVVDSEGNEYKIKDLIEKEASPPRHKLYAIMALQENGDKIYTRPTQFDFDQFKRAKQALHSLENELPLPTMSVRSGHNTNQAKGYNYNYWRDFFNERQLLCLGLLLRRIVEIKDDTIRHHFICLFSGTLEFNNLFCSFKGEGTGAVRHMFSNHILKPERTPLENCVWGIQGKSSGTFSTLFRSRLIKAKEYLNKPFELFINNDGNRKKSRKIICSNPIKLTLSKEWDSFNRSKAGAMILNGDSSNLPIPDNSVDAVVTDPPYFDFIHYSELSDFFYAWLSKVLCQDFEYFSHKNSSHKNEVQDKDNERFSEKIATIFSECFRVLKKDGLMCFSYHHSTIEGWMAIYNAITKSGFYIVATHPVKAEMSVGSPKSATKKPINIDAIIVCKKETKPPSLENIQQELISRYENYLTRFETIGRTLGQGDKFVIACSQAISIASIVRMDDIETKKILEWASNFIFEKR